MENNKTITTIPMVNVIVLFIFFLSRQVAAQTNSEILNEDLLRTEIIKMDSLLFDVAFNQCDAAQFKKIIADDVEFYDDRFGLNVSKENEIKSLNAKCSRPEKLTRKLNSCTIDKLGDFGAVQVGEHTFYIDGKPEGTGKFIHIWERKDKDWKLKRIVSYEHRPIKK
ncbi:nuclear transport factor 2 family protein [Flavobacterium piscisymbiosum]|uniref:Nuclear transport factor 2 family protein n=1 Tax=Flavobacterium piscisymbiosum TaxID=2893753 RepID=A0ABS8MAE6_9FLAO|nr:nuclear transport factor 2 family protein [Flavobacterium sp. F-30]MCC9061921.1 nuclear transport factor 2 family protein [Flavobacterium sp. F-30]